MLQRKMPADTRSYVGGLALIFNKSSHTLEYQKILISEDSRRRQVDGKDPDFSNEAYKMNGDIKAGSYDPANGRPNILMLLEFDISS